jgi:WD40 repeat protein
VLAISRTGAYAIQPNGNTQHLGSFSEAGWSPHGEHVVGVDGRRLVAVDPEGTLKWTLVRRGVHDPAWSTRLGFAVAYLQGRTLRVVDGTGSAATDRPVRTGAAAVRPAWRPHSDRVLTYATGGGMIETVDVITRRGLWKAQVSQAPLALAWSRDGRRLVALSSRSVTVLDRSGRVLRTIALPGVARDLALHPSGARAAVVVGSGVEEVPLTGGKPHRLFQGDVDGLAWSPDGSRLLLGWRDTGQWLLFGPGGRKRALNKVSRELGAVGGFPRVAGWCCSG